MPSKAFQKWQTDRADELDEIVAAHVSIGGSGRGRRFATRQINHAYAMLLSSQFQGFCRDLHTEAAYWLAGSLATSTLHGILLAEFQFGRKLDQGNPSPGNIGSDFNRLGIHFWDELHTRDPRNAQRRQELEILNHWRNAIAHQDFNPQKLCGQVSLRLAIVRQWRRTCDDLAHEFEEVMKSHLTLVTGNSPW